MRKGNRVFRVERDGQEQWGNMVGLLVIDMDRCQPIAFVPEPNKRAAQIAADIAASPGRVIEFAGVKDWRKRIIGRHCPAALCNAVLWPVDRNGRIIRRGYWGCVVFTPGVVGSRWSAFLVDMDNTRIDKKSGRPVCLYIPGVGRIGDTEAGTRTAAVVNEKGRVGLKAKDNTVLHRAGVVSVA